MSKIRLFIFLLTLLFINISQYSVAQINVVSGIKGEVYNQFAQDIANNTSVKLNVYTSKGSVDNLRFLLSDSIQVAFMQYDVLHDAGLKNDSLKELVKVFLPLYSEEIHIVTLKSSGIKQLTDLIGKRLGVGDSSSGSFFTAEHIAINSGINWDMVQVDFGSSVSALLNGRIEAFLFVGAAPANLLINQPQNIADKLSLVDVNLSAGDDCYTRKTIPAKTYNWQNEPVETYAVKSLLVVNTKNIDAGMAMKIDSLYNDLKYNLKGIQLNKFSHPKWKSVEFSNLQDVEWGVFREEYTLKKRINDYLGLLAAILSFFQIYFIINKLWKRKHEQVVAESISISAMFISLIINFSFGFQNLTDGAYSRLSNNLLWILASSMSLIIGVGVFVSANKGTNFFKLLGRALNLERSEAGDLAKAFFQPSAADKIIDILGRLAMIDNDLDIKERQYIQKFADDWHIEIDWDEIERYRDISGDRYNKLRESLYSYLKVNPPKEQVSHLIDVIILLINADGKVTHDEALMQAELTGIIKEYLGEGDEVEYFKIAVVPQNPQQEEAIAARFPNLNKVEIAGGFAFISESYYSEDYAEEVSLQYRSLHIFSIVFKPKNILNIDDLNASIEEAKKAHE
jgi:TRAP transporter TAXI family solute receptor